jgi:hypothetical protein
MLIQRSDEPERQSLSAHQTAQPQREVTEPDTGGDKYFGARWQAKRDTALDSPIAFTQV